MPAKFKRGAHVFVPWGLDVSRAATIVEVWGDPDAPSQVRVELARTDDDEGATLLLAPSVLRSTP